jgi:hypothetical protein
MRLEKLVLIAFSFSQFGFGQLYLRQPASKKRKAKSLTTAQIYKIGPFRGGQTTASLPSTVKSF